MYYNFRFLCGPMLRGIAASFGSPYHALKFEFSSADRFEIREDYRYTLSKSVPRKRIPTKLKKLFDIIHIQYSIITKIKILTYIW